MLSTGIGTAVVVLLLRFVVSSSSTISAFTAGPSPARRGHHGRVVVTRTRTRRETAPVSAVRECVEGNGDGDGDRGTEDAVSPPPLVAVQGGRGGEDGDAAEAEGRRDVASLRRWAAAAGIRLADGVELTAGAEGGGDDWGVSLVGRRRGKLRAGDAVLHVPRSVVLSSRTILERHGGDDAYRPALDVLESAGLGHYEPELILVIEILSEWSRGGSSLWHTWLRSLPTTFDTGVYMDDVERSFLPPIALALARLEDRKLDAFRSAIGALVAEAEVGGHNDRFGDLSRMMESSSSGGEGGDDSDVGDDDVVRWAYSVVFTRCWRRSGETGPDADACIVPIGDMFNHREPSNVVVRDDSDDSVDIVLKHDLPVDAGGDAETGLYLSYGLPDPHRYLVMFGFVDETMPEIFSQLLFPHPITEGLLSLGCNDVSAMVFRTDDGRIANAVWDCALYATISALESKSKREEDLRELLDAHDRGDGAAKAALHARYALEVCVYLWRHVEATLADLRTDFDEGECCSQGEESRAEDRPRLRLVIRHNEFVSRVFRKVKRRLEWMISTELKKRGGKA